MHDARRRRAARGTAALAVIILALGSGALVAASGGAVTASPTATGATSSIKANTGGSAPWVFVLAIVAAIAIFILGGLFIVLRSRSDYLAEQARKAAKVGDDDETPISGVADDL